ncbi:MAG: 4-hydroxy-tetrahydrodipicolinate reductase [bacterium]
MNIELDFIGYTGKTGSIVYNYLKTKYQFKNLVNSSNYKQYLQNLQEINNNNSNFFKLIVDLSSKSFIWDFTTNIKKPIPIFYVTGVTGFDIQEFQTINDHFKKLGIYGFHFPNFSIGMNLINKVVQEISKFFDEVEIIEMHHKTKKDKPSGTSLMTSKIIHNVLKKEIPIHSVRLPSLLAHQKVIFSNEFGEILELTHHNFNRTSFALGIEKVIQQIFNDPYEIERKYSAGLHYNLNIFDFLYN